VLVRLAKLDLLAIDDWLLAALTDAERRDLLEVIEDRSERASTLIASQLPPTAWHAAIGEPSVADAICDRLIHRAHRLTLKGPTMRDPGTRRGKATS
jgi:DNA replication protein DnaC